MSEKYSIKMSVVPETETKDRGASRFFGVPFVPSSMKENYISMSIFSSETPREKLN